MPEIDDIVQMEECQMPPTWTFRQRHPPVFFANARSAQCHFITFLASSHPTQDISLIQIPCHHMTDSVECVFRYIAFVWIFCLYRMSYCDDYKLLPNESNPFIALLNF